MALLFALEYAPFFAIGVLFYNSRRRAWQGVEFLLLFAAFSVMFLISQLEGLLVAVTSTFLLWAAISGHLSFLTNRITLWLGSISYALYLTHRNIGYELLPLFHERGVGVLASVVTVSVVVIGLAALVTAVIEKPALRSLRRFSKSERLRRARGQYNHT